MSIYDGNIELDPDIAALQGRVYGANLEQPNLTLPVTGFVASLNSQTGVVALIAGTNIGIAAGGGSITISATGIVTATGTLTSGRLIRGNGGSDITVGDLTGDVTTSGGLAATIVAQNSAFWAGKVSDETGSGLWVFNNTPTLIAPLLGTPTSGVLTNCTGLPISTGVSGLAAGVATFLATPSSANLAAALTDETGSGANVFATSPTLVTPLLGTPTSGTLTNCTGLPISTGVSGLGAGVATFLATPTSANFAAAVTGETGTGGVVFDTSPTLVTPTIGAALGTSLLLGHTAALGRLSQTLEITSSATYGGLALNTFSVTADMAKAVDFNRSRNATIGSHTVVQSGDSLGHIVFRGSDGTGFIDAARILGSVDGTPGTNDMPGRLTFWTTPDGSATLAERVRITNAGNMGIGTTPNANAILDVASTTKAFMPPRMTTAQRDAIASPTAGMVVYNSTTNKLNVYTTLWEAITSA